MRAFIAIELPAAFRDEVASVARQLSAAVEGRFIPRENYHITLAFLGDIDEGTARRAIAALERAAAGRLVTAECSATAEAVGASLTASGTAETVGAAPAASETAEIASSSPTASEAAVIPLIPDGIGKFGRASNATLWIGLEKTPELMTLASGVREALREEGVDFDNTNDFLPHITLARHANVAHAQLPELLFPQEAEATKVTLFKSTLERSGAIYKPLFTVKLDVASAR